MKLRRLTLITLGLAISVILVACRDRDILPLPSPTASPVTTEVKISEPADGATVAQTERVKGTSRNVPDGKVVWIVAFVHAVGRYYPQNYPADVQANGDWSSLAYLGVATDVGLKFDIIAVLADKNIQAAFNNYLKDAKDKQSYPGLDQLPKGTLIYDRITVTRK